ncbi:MAG: choice-of-anchor Q domain-containing protein [Terriglobia bacterium]
MQTHKYAQMALVSLFALCTLALAAPARAATLLVGPTRTYKTPCAAIAAASAGDVILIDPVLYTNDTCAWSTNNLTLIGILGPNNQRPHIDDSGLTDTPTTGHIAFHKGIWVPLGKDTVVKNVEFSGATLSNDDGANGAGIRIDGVNMTIINCYFHNNQDGILESNVAGSNIVIEFSEFAHNGVGDPTLTEGYGQTHNLYIGHAASLLFAFNYSHDANVGHLLKSRAAVNYILYNRLTGENGTDSYEIDLPNGGTSYVIGNLVQKGPNSQNHSAMLTYMEEGANPSNPGSDLYVVNNDFVNQSGHTPTFVSVGTADTTPALLQNDIFYGAGAPTNQTAATLKTNFTGDPLFVNLDDFNYHLTDESPAINAGSEPGRVLKPKYQYVHPACGQRRHNIGRIDIGAYEFRGGGRLLRCRAEVPVRPF